MLDMFIWFMLLALGGCVWLTPRNMLDTCCDELPLGAGFDGKALFGKFWFTIMLFVLYPPGFGLLTRGMLCELMLGTGDLIVEL